MRRAVLALSFVVACGESATPLDDAGVADAGAVDASPIADAGGDEPDLGPILEPVAPRAPASPSITPCSFGWFELEGACVPFPADQRETCMSPGEAHFPGHLSCEPIGSTCPTGQWPADLPLDRPLIFASADAAPGGTGTSTAPFATIAAAIAAAPGDAVIVLGKTAFMESVELDRELELRGACAELTSIASLAVRAPGAVRDLELGALSISSSAELEGVTITGDATALAGARLAFARVVARGAVSARSDARIELGDSILELGLSASGSAAFVSAHNVVVRGAATGISIAGGADFSGEAVAIEDAALIGATVSTSPSRMRIVQANLKSAGVLAQRGGNLELIRARLFRSDVTAQDSGGRIAITDSVILDAPARDGAAMFAEDGATITARRVAIDSSADRGAQTEGQGASIVLAEVAISDTGGEGVAAQNGATLELEVVRIERATSFGVFADGPGARIAVRDLAVHGTRSDPNGFDGTGLACSSGAAIEGLRVEAIDNRAFGIAAAIGTIELRDVLVRGTTAEACHATGCETIGVGHGLVAGAQATIALDRFRAESNASCGLALFPSGRALLNEGVIRANRYARCLPEDWHELVETRVETRDNTEETYLGPELRR